jgi:hypothetical protein
MIASSKTLDTLNNDSTGPVSKQKRGFSIPNDPEEMCYLLTASSELRAELQFPSSGLLKFKYPQRFPFLSMPTPREQADTSPQDTTGDIPQVVDSNSRLDAEDEQSWLHYLAEIALRGVMNRILDAFYSHGEDYWIKNILAISDHRKTSHEELVLW